MDQCPKCEFHRKRANLLTEQIQRMAERSVNPPVAIRVGDRLISEPQYVKMKEESENFYSSSFIQRVLMAARKQL